MLFSFSRDNKQHLRWLIVPPLKIACHSEAVADPEKTSDLVVSLNGATVTPEGNVTVEDKTSQIVVDTVALYESVMVTIKPDIVPSAVTVKPASTTVATEFVIV